MGAPSVIVGIRLSVLPWSEKLARRYSGWASTIRRQNIYTTRSISSGSAIRAHRRGRGYTSWVKSCSKFGTEHWQRVMDGDSIHLKRTLSVFALMSLWVGLITGTTRKNFFWMSSLDSTGLNEG